VNKYEAMIIFPDALKDEALEAALEKVEAEIEKSGGKVESKTRMGRRQFARPMDKQNSGQYMVVNFKLDGDKLTALQARFKLNEEIFRIQIVRASEIIPVPAPVASDK
jgi:small subunit ribosomal protein S6